MHYKVVVSTATIMFILCLIHAFVELFAQLHQTEVKKMFDVVTRVKYSMLYTFSFLPFLLIVNNAYTNLEIYVCLLWIFLSKQLIDGSFLTKTWAKYVKNADEFFALNTSSDDAFKKWLMTNNGFFQSKMIGLFLSFLSLIVVALIGGL